MSWIFLTVLVFPISVFMLYLIKDMINLASRPSIKTHKRPTSQPSYQYSQKRNIYIAK